MNGAVFIAIAVLVAGVILLLGASPIFLVPIAILVVVGFVTGVASFAGRAIAGQEPSGVPSTESAAYDPTRESAERTL